MVRMQETFKGKGYTVRGGINSNIQRISDQIKEMGDQIVECGLGGSKSPINLSTFKIRDMIRASINVDFINELIEVYQILNDMPKE